MDIWFFLVRVYTEEHSQQDGRTGEDDVIHRCGQVIV